MNFKPTLPTVIEQYHIETNTQHNIEKTFSQAKFYGVGAKA
jgi:hypothetical protein